MNFSVLSLFMLILAHNGLSRYVAMKKDGKGPESLSNNSDLVDDNEVAPPKHLDAVKMGRDGKINSKFHKEVFLGEDIENFENGNYQNKEQKTKLEEIFHKVDSNRDKSLDENEMASWVLEKTKEHFEEARLGNEEKFIKLDRDHDGRLTWNEYLIEFLGEKGFNKEEVSQKLEEKVKIEIVQALQDEIEDLKDKWNEVVMASNQVHDSQLNQSQFLDFQHPETSRYMLNYMVDEFLHDLDINADGNLSIYEFLSISPDSDPDAAEDEWSRSRRDEFVNVIDQNKNGIVTRQELETYLDPLSKTMAEQEARQLISFGDDNQNQKLSLDELLSNSEYYTGSKLYNYAKSVHEEF